MLRIYPNFLNDQDFNRVVSLLNRDQLFDVPNSPNVKSCQVKRLGVKSYIEQFGQVAFQEILVYSVGSESLVHVDIGYDGEEWMYTGILICNEEYEGGELYFPNLGIEIKPPKNTFIIFPAGSHSNIYAHGVKPIINGERLTAIFRFI